MTSSLRPEGGLPPTQGQPADPLAELLAESGPAPRPDFQSALRSRVLGLPPSAGHWILRLPGRKPLYLPTLPTAMSLLVLGAALLASGWMLLDGNDLITSSPETVPLIDLVPASPAEVERDSTRVDEGSEDVPESSAGSDGLSAEDVERDVAGDVDGSAGETAAKEPADAPNAEQPGRLPTSTVPPTLAPSATATTAPAPTATATEPPPPPPPGDDDDDDDPPTPTPVPPTATATFGPPPLPEPIASATIMPTQDLQTVEPPTLPEATPSPAAP